MWSCGCQGGARNHILHALCSRPRRSMRRSAPRLSQTLWHARARCRASRARSASGLSAARARASCVSRMVCACVCSVEQFWVAHNLVLCRFMAAFSASLGPGRRAAGSMRGRSVGAEPPAGGVVCGVDARVLAGERGQGGGLHTCMCTLPETSFLGRLSYAFCVSCVCDGRRGGRWYENAAGFTLRWGSAFRFPVSAAAFRMADPTVAWTRHASYSRRF